MIEERKRPLKLFRVVKAYGPYRVGDRIQPTGIYRNQLLNLKVIEEVTDAVAAPALGNRMVDLVGDQPVLMNRKRGGR